MIFFDEASPIPGSASSSCCEAVLTSIRPPRLEEPAGAAAVDAVAFAALTSDFSDDFSAFEEAAFLEVDAAAFSGAAGPVASDFTVTLDFSLEIVEAGTPALLRSSTEPYGRPAMIFLAVASPTPGSASSSCWEAVLRSTFGVLDFAAWAGAACRASPSMMDERIGKSRSRR